MAEVANRFRDWLRSRWLPWQLAALAIALCLPSLWLGWQMDDHIHRAALVGVPDFPEMSRSPEMLFAFVDGDPQHNHQTMDAGWLPWWSSPRLRLSLFRPLTGYTHWVDYKLWPDLPALMHAQSLLWFALLVAMTATFYRRMMGPVWVAGLAALLFAIDDAHGFAADWLANRNASLAMLFGVVSLISYDRWRRDSWRPGAYLAPSLLLVGLLAGEMAVATGAYLFAYALFLDRGRLRRRLYALLPCALVGVAWWTCYKIMGFGAAGSGMYIDPGADPLRFLYAAVERAPILIWGQWAFPPSDIVGMLSRPAVGVAWVIAVAFISLLVAILAPLLRRDAVARFWAVGSLLSVLPICATFCSQRLLLFTGLGAMGLLAQFFSAMWGKARWLPKLGVWRVSARLFLVGFIVVHLVLAPLLLVMVSQTVRSFGALSARAAASLPDDPQIREQHVLIVNTPTAFMSMFGPVLQALNGRPVAGRTTVLGSSIYPIEVERRDQRSLVIRPRHGFLADTGLPGAGRSTTRPYFEPLYFLPQFDALFRDVGERFEVGEAIHLTGLTIEILAVTDDSRPAEVAFHFDRPLEDSSLRWLRWQASLLGEGGIYVPFVLPAVGETVTLRL